MLSETGISMPVHSSTFHRHDNLCVVATINVPAFQLTMLARNCTLTTTEYEGAIDVFINGGFGFNNPTKDADLLIQERPFEYEASEELIVVSLGTGGNLYKEFINTALGKAALIEKAATECRTTAQNMHRQYKGYGNVKYYRFDPDAVGRYAADDVTAFNTIQNEISNWCDAEIHDKLRVLAERLLHAMTEIVQVCHMTATDITNSNTSKYHLFVLRIATHSDYDPMQSHS
jgi:hypothetical protein